MAAQHEDFSMENDTPAAAAAAAAPAANLPSIHPIFHEFMTKAVAFEAATAAAAVHLETFSNEFASLPATTEQLPASIALILHKEMQRLEDDGASSSACERIRCYSLQLRCHEPLKDQASSVRLNRAILLLQQHMVQAHLLVDHLSRLLQDAAAATAIPCNSRQQTSTEEEEGERGRRRSIILATSAASAASAAESSNSEASSSCGLPSGTRSSDLGKRVEQDLNSRPAGQAMPAQQAGSGSTSGLGSSEEQPQRPPAAFNGEEEEEEEEEDDNDDDNDNDEMKQEAPDDVGISFDEMTRCWNKSTLMLAIHHMFTQDINMQDEIVKHVCMLDVTIESLASFCMLWKLRPHIDERLLNEAISWL